MTSRTGQILKENREAQKIAISEVAMATKISARVISSIEEGDDEYLPPETFLRGFVRTYARYLNVDENLVMGSLNEELGTPPPSHFQPEPEPEEDGSSAVLTWIESLPFLKSKSIASKTFAVVGIVLLLFIIGGIKSVVDRYEQESLVPPPPDDITKVEIQESSKPLIESAQKKPPTRTKVPAPIENTGDKNDVNNVPPANTTKLTALARPETEPKPLVESKKIKIEPKEAPVFDEPPPKKVEKVTEKPPIAKKTKPNIEPQEVIVMALDSVRVSYRLDSEVIKRVTLEPQQIVTLKAREKISIDLSDGGAVNLVYNGRDQGVPGDLGASKKVRFPE